MDLDSDLLKAVFGTIADEVEVFEIMRDEHHRIVDFRYLFGSTQTTRLSNGNGSILSQSLSSGEKKASLFEKFMQVIETGDPLDLIFPEGTDDHQKWFQVKARKFNGGLVVYKQDVSIAKQAEEKIMGLNRSLFSKNREHEALSSELKTFNTIAANDYNETLKNLYTSMEFIISNDAKNLSDAGKANIRRAQAAIQKMKLLTEDIIAFSKVHSEEQMTAVDLNETLLIVQSSLDEKIKRENALIRGDQLPVINGYPALISLLFYHLISNAIKFRKPETDPVIDIHYAHMGGMETGHSLALPDISYHVISVIDNGVGFDPQEGEKIFTIFHRLNEKGKQKGGIGLAICKKIMDLHGGFIASECNPECTTFKCFFPSQN